MAIEKSFPKMPTDVLYTAMSLMQKWSILLKAEDKEQVLQVKESIMGWLRDFKPSTTTCSDIVEI